MARPYTDPSIDEYLRERLMPVEGTIPHLPGIEMYANSIPAGTVGGDLFEPDTSDSQANRVDRIHVGYVDERARSIDTPNTKENGGDCIQLVARTMI